MGSHRWDVHGHCFDSFCTTLLFVFTYHFSRKQGFRGNTFRSIQNGKHITNFILQKYRNATMSVLPEFSDRKSHPPNQVEMIGIEDINA